MYLTLNLLSPDFHKNSSTLLVSLMALLLHHVDQNTFRPCPLKFDFVKIVQSFLNQVSPVSYLFIQPAFK